ncbi:geranylgeranyl diphosphate synthase type I [Kribbella voronezhensis]|uniref:Geranylgeranyl diphosphate synthase type I n=1 Tax=Kribbella voronezhensis TaxID=2512212 RepID=A0A4R7T572_9ACTN|nr:polyprenyl synthetase family protein [Kribbella voronezhensis]TDU86990.1 geranylgeranyl diphosphate synthase type I [Kribbella voronezhensis]
MYADADIPTEVQRALTNFLDIQAERLAEIGPELAEPVQAARDATAGGKRLRPSFCYWGFRAAGGDTGQPILTAAASLEMLHVSALVHDDVMDSSDVRRGAPAAHRRFEALQRARSANSGRGGDPVGFGVGAAILLGDLCLIWADEMLHTSGFDAAALARASKFFDAVRVEVTAGQYLDLVAQASGEADMDRALRVLRYKSATYTVERPLHIGAALAGADQLLIDALSTYGLPLGEAFQLRDDLLGVFGDPTVTGKPAGDDLREGKRTVLTAYAVEHASEVQLAEFDRLFGRRDLDDDEIQLLREILQDSRAVQACEDLITDKTEDALAALDRAPIEDENVRKALADLVVAATSRHL